MDSHLIASRSLLVLQIFGKYKNLTKFMATGRRHRFNSFATNVIWSRARCLAVCRASLWRKPLGWVVRDFSRPVVAQRREQLLGAILDCVLKDRQTQTTPAWGVNRFTRPQIATFSGADTGWLSAISFQRWISRSISRLRRSIVPRIRISLNAPLCLQHRRTHSCRCCRHTQRAVMEKNILAK